MSSGGAVGKEVGEKRVILEAGHMCSSLYGLPSHVTKIVTGKDEATFCIWRDCWRSLGVSRTQGPGEWSRHGGWAGSLGRARKSGGSLSRQTRATAGGRRAASQHLSWQSSFLSQSYWESESSGDTGSGGDFSCARLPRTWLLCLIGRGHDYTVLDELDGKKHSGWLYD